MKLEKELKELQKVELDKPNSVLSMYLNTNPADPEAQNGGWKIQLKNGLNSFGNYLEQSEDEQELKNFKKVREKVENYIQENLMNLQKSVVIFASADDSVWFARSVEMDVKTEFHWQENAVTDQLYQLYMSFPKVGIVLVQQNNVKTIEAELGSILDRNFYYLDDETEEWHRTDKIQKEASLSRGNSDHIVAVQKRGYKQLAPILDKLAANRGWDKTFVVGEGEESEELVSYMTQGVDVIENRNMLDHKETKILETVVA